jgi:hypothetical protein
MYSQVDRFNYPQQNAIRQFCTAGSKQSLQFKIELKAFVITIFTRANDLYFLEVPCSS